MASRPTMALVPSAPRNLDLPTAGWYAFRAQEVPSSLPKRGEPSKQGQAIKAALNTFPVTKFGVGVPKVYCYDIQVGSGAERKAVIKKVWNSAPVQNIMGSVTLFDGEHLAWSLNSHTSEQRFWVDLDAEAGRTPRPNARPNRFEIKIRQTHTIDFDYLAQYLQGRVAFDNKHLEAINFLDHALRESPSRRYTAIKRMFFEHGQQRHPLSGPIEAFKGVYQSVRIAHSGPGTACLTVNIDVANGTFWSQGKLTDAAVALTGARNVADLAAMLRREGERGKTGTLLKKFRRLVVVTRHRGGTPTEVCIDRFLYQGARDYTFEHNGSTVSLYDYYAQVYRLRLQHPELPLVKSTKGRNTLFPMELLNIEENKRYNFKLDDRQTRSMLDYAVQPPPKRWLDVEHGLRILDWANDPVLQKYGISIDTRRTVVNGRLLPAPVVKFGTGEAKPGTSGRWDLKGKKFLASNTQPLKSWSVCVVSGRRGGKPDRTIVERFIQQFIQIYQGHGGRIENKQPKLFQAMGDDPGVWVTEAWNQAGNQANTRPQLLVFILPDKESERYGRIKRSAECRYGVVSQCMQYVHVEKAQAQYMSNVCMKVNAKLGGITARAIGLKSGGPAGLFTEPTMIIGGDVSHAAPGAEAASMAALTVSLDKLATRYAAVVQTNGYREEIIQENTFRQDLAPMVKHWMDTLNNGKVPARVMYFRDGVSEGQYQHVLAQEVRVLKELFKSQGGNPVKFVVIIGTKRHHVRFFPEKGDRNGNALPGTLVETGVTHPFENNFYLVGHNALKGTARPVMYHILLNEAGMRTEDIQTLIYEHGYQFCRSTTPISEFPAIRYAHIASNRGIPHDSDWSFSRPPGAESTATPEATRPVLPMPNNAGINTAMWYV